MSINVKINKFRAHTAFAKGKGTDNLPKRITTPSEINSMSALFSVQKYCSKIEEIVQNMRKLCPLSEMDCFFSAYAEYKNRISSIVDQSNMILRKLSPNFQQPTYQTGEDLRRYHEEFMTAVSHLNLQKQPVYFHSITEFMNKLPLDLDKYLMKYKNNGQVKQYLGTFEPKFREKLHKLDQDIRTILLPIEFEHLDFDRVYELVERLRSIHRQFEVSLMTAVKQKAPKDIHPLPKDTEWHTTVIALVPIISNLPMFVENSHLLCQSIPDLTMAIEKLCTEIDDLLPSDQGAFNDTTKKVVYSDDKVDKILDDASSFLGITFKKDLSKIDKLNIVIEKSKDTVNGLQNKIEETKKEKETVQEEFDRSNIVKRFQRIRAASDDIAKKFEGDKDNFLFTIVEKLRTLVSFDFDLDEGDPYRMFNAIFNRLQKELDLLKQSKDGKSISEFLNKNNNKSEDNEYKKSFVKLCSWLTKQKEETFAEKTPEELIQIAQKGYDSNDELKLIDVDKLMQLVPAKYDKDNYLESLKSDLKKMEYTLEAVVPFNEIESKLSSLLDQNESAFLPTSPNFSNYLDSLSQMRDVLNKVDTNLMHKPVHSLLVKSAELFNSLAISLSSASFAPEYSPSQKVVETLLTDQQNMNLSLSRLRILLEEKDTLLLAETRKLAKLEKQFKLFVNEHQNSNENIDAQKLVFSIETNESESDCF